MFLIREIIDSLVEAEFKTKNDSPITFQILENDEDLGRGWVVHRIEAFVEDVPAGYIKISFIPHVNFEKEYPTILHYLGKVEGKNFFPLSRSANYSAGERPMDFFHELPLYEQVWILKHFNGGRWVTKELAEELKVLPSSELKKLYRMEMSEIKKTYGKKFKDFINFHVDKPLVDYIKVNEEFRRKRIAIALYSKAAEWLSESGLKLYASGIQTDAAKAAWEWIRANLGANVGTENYSGRIRTFLSF
jgi:GNAT superfamily N-acetyltransferase